MVVQCDFSPVEERFISWSTDLSYKSGDNALAWIREISRNVVTPAFILRRLALSSDPELRMAVADHLNTPVAVLMLLAEDDNADVRYALAENHNISRDVHHKLLNDSNPYVANRAERTLSRRGQAMGRESLVPLCIVRAKPIRLIKMIDQGESTTK